MLAKDHFDSRRTITVSNMHHSMINVNDIKIADEDCINTWGIEPGEPFVDLKRDCRSGYKGDDASMLNWPTSSSSVSLGGIWGFFWRDGLLSHSRYSNISTIISGEGCHSQTVREESLKQMSDLWNLNKLVFWSDVQQ